MNLEMIVLPALIGAFVAMFFNLVSKIGEQTIAKHFDRYSRRENERDGDLNEFCKIVFEIRDLSVTYWMRSSDNSEKVIISASIVGRLTFANSIIEDLYGSKSVFTGKCIIYLTNSINRVRLADLKKRQVRMIQKDAGISKSQPINWFIKRIIFEEGFNFSRNHRFSLSRLPDSSLALLSGKTSLTERLLVNFSDF